MAILNIINDETSTSELGKIRAYLSRQGIDFGEFELGERARSLAALQTLTDEQRAELIALHPEAEARFRERQGFRADVVCFYPELVHLDFIINKFGSIHYHFENEYWYFVDGEACFGFLGGDGTKFEIIPRAGEYLHVPEGCWQWFGLTAAKRMKSIRFFYTDGRARPRVPVRLDEI